MNFEELKNLLDAQGRSFEAFKAANDQRLQQLEKGAADVVTTASIEKINLDISARQAVIDKALAAINARADEIELKAGRRALGAGHDGDKRAAAAARFYALAQNRRVAPSEADVEAYDLYCNAFDGLVRRGGNVDALPANLRNAMTVGSDPSGGYFVPTEMSMEIERRVFETSPMRQISRVITIGAEAWEGPYRSADATSGGWVGEKAARTATATAAGGMQRIPAHEQYAYPELTQKLLDDAAIDAQALVIDETEDKMSRTENTAFVSGSGINQPRGFLDYRTAAVTTDDASRDWGKLQYIVTGASGAFPSVSGSVADDPDCLITTIAKLNPAYRGNARWAMSRATEAIVRRLKDADGRYLVGFGDLRDNALGFNLLGFPIANMEDMSAVAADSFSIAFGDFRRGYLIVDRIGFRLLIDPYTNKPYVGFYITKRTGGDVRNFDAIKLVKFGTS